MSTHEKVDRAAIREFAETPDENGRKPTQAQIAEHFDVNAATIRRALVAERPRRETVAAREEDEVKRVYRFVADYIATNGWAPSQRAIADGTSLMTSRVNYILQVMVHQGLIDLGPNPREIRLVGARMVIPKVTL